MSNTVKNIQKKKKKGFTLIELIIVIAIIGILALIAIPRFGAARKNANISADVANAKTIHDATARKMAEGTLVVTDGAVDIGTLSDVLQTTPTPKAEGSAFSIAVDADEDITVNVGDKEVYPNKAADYGDAD